MGGPHGGVGDCQCLMRHSGQRMPTTNVSTIAAVALIIIAGDKKRKYGKNKDQANCRNEIISFHNRKFGLVISVLRIQKMKEKTTNAIGTEKYLTL